MSPRAACRLTQLGFAPVYDYTHGKVDWIAAGLPTDRAGQPSRRVLDAVRRDVPTCAPDSPAGPALEAAGPDAGEAGRARLAGAGWAAVEEREPPCCYARQDKFWVTGAPGGERWEIYSAAGPAAGGASWAAAGAATGPGRSAGS